MNDQRKLDLFVPPIYFLLGLKENSIPYHFPYAILFRACFREATNKSWQILPSRELTYPTFKKEKKLIFKTALCRVLCYFPGGYFINVGKTSPHPFNRPKTIQSSSHHFSQRGVFCHHRRQRPTAAPKAGFPVVAVEGGEGSGQLLGVFVGFDAWLGLMVWRFGDF